MEVPSQWLAELVRESFLRDYPIRVVPNRVDTEVFHPTESDFRQRMGLENSFLVLGVANVWEPRKGLADFLRLSTLLPDCCRIVLVGLPEKQIKKLPAGVLGLPRTPDSRTLAQVYTAADVYVCPSVEETFGMTVLEAACCGTTPIVYQHTACQEVAEAHGGLAVPRGAENLASAIVALMRREEL